MHLPDLIVIADRSCQFGGICREVSAQSSTLMAGSYDGTSTEQGTNAVGDLSKTWIPNCIELKVPCRNPQLIAYELPLMKRTDGAIFGTEYSAKRLPGSICDEAARRLLRDRLIKSEDLVGVALYKVFEVVARCRFSHFELPLRWH